MIKSSDTLGQGIYPKPGQKLPKLLVIEKPGYRGFVARLVGMIVWLASKFSLDGKIGGWAYGFNTFGTTIRGTFYIPSSWVIKGDGLVVIDWRGMGAGLELHERVHQWQEEKLGVIRYFWLYLARPIRGRLLLEAMAYGSEVFADWRTMDNAVDSLVNRTYYPEPWANPPTKEHARLLLRIVVAEWSAAGHAPESMREMIR